MKTSSARTLALGLALSASSAFAVSITEWNFDADSTTPSIGAGTAALVGGTTATFATGNGGGRGWNTTTYAAQSTGSGTRGVEFFASTVGFTDITVSFDHRASGTASRWSEIFYTLDGGGNWVSFSNNAGGLSPHDTFHSFNFDFSAVTGTANNADFGLRVVSIFSPSAFDQNASLGDFTANSAYMRANSQASFTAGGGIGSGDYGTSGTWRFDNVVISGSAIPEPASAAALIGLGAMGVVAGRRRRA